MVRSFSTTTLTIATMSNADGVTYTQTGNAASIKSTDGTWFSNSTINLEGGVMNRSAEGLGMGNTYNVKASGASQIPGGDLNNDDWKNGCRSSPWVRSRVTTS